MTSDPRGLLLGDAGFEDGYEVDIPLAFVDLPPRPRERFTLVGCVPSGAPAEALGTGRAFLGCSAIGRHRRCRRSGCSPAGRNRCC